MSARQGTASRIKAAVRREDTVVRLGGDVYCAALTWTADDRQLLAFIDGAGWPEIPQNHYYSSRLAAVSGMPGSAAFEDVANYPDISLWDIYQRSAPPYYGLNVLADGARIYQYLSTSTLNVFTAEVAFIPGFHFNAAKLIYSADNGRTWRNQDGSTPVVREPHAGQTRQSMAFLQVPQAAFSRLSFLQMGQAYSDNKDGYIYVYAPNGAADGASRELVMFRVRRDRILDGTAYEYFAGLCGNGAAEWTADIGRRAVVHTFAEDWGSYVLSSPSVAYVSASGVYLMVNASCANLGGTRPGGFGIWVGEHPWGPWRQILEEVAWTPAGNPAARAGAPVIAPKWIAADGRSFWLVWNEGQFDGADADGMTEHEVVMAMRSSCVRSAFQGRHRWRRCHPGWSFNAQRVDLLIE